VDSATVSQIYSESSPRLRVIYITKYGQVLADARTQHVRPLFHSSYQINHIHAARSCNRNKAAIYSSFGHQFRSPLFFTSLNSKGRHHMLFSVQIATLYVASRP
jgi:hypothetical protein